MYWLKYNLSGFSYSFQPTLYFPYFPFSSGTRCTYRVVFHYKLFPQASTRIFIFSFSFTVSLRFFLFTFPPFSLFPECVLRAAVAGKVASGQQSPWLELELGIGPCWPMNSGLTIRLLTARVLPTCVMNRLISFDFPATPTHPCSSSRLCLRLSSPCPRPPELCYNRDFFRPRETCLEFNFTPRGICQLSSSGNNLTEWI